MGPYTLVEGSSVPGWIYLLNVQTTGLSPLPNNNLAGVVSLTYLDEQGKFSIANINTDNLWKAIPNKLLRFLSQGDDEEQRAFFDIMPKGLAYLALDLLNEEMQWKWWNVSGVNLNGTEHGFPSLAEALLHKTYFIDFETDIDRKTIAAFALQGNNPISASVYGSGLHEKLNELGLNAPVIIANDISDALSKEAMKLNNSMLPLILAGYTGFDFARMNGPFGINVRGTGHNNKYWSFGSLLLDPYTILKGLLPHENSLVRMAHSFEADGQGGMHVKMDTLGYFEMMAATGGKQKQAEMAVVQSAADVYGLRDLTEKIFPLILDIARLYGTDITSLSNYSFKFHTRRVWRNMFWKTYDPSIEKPSSFADVADQPMFYISPLKDTLGLTPYKGYGVFSINYESALPYLEFLKEKLPQKRPIIDTLAGYMNHKNPAIKTLANKALYELAAPIMALREIMTENRLIYHDGNLIDELGNTISDDYLLNVRVLTKTLKEAQQEDIFQASPVDVFQASPKDNQDDPDEIIAEPQYDDLPSREMPNGKICNVIREYDYYTLKKLFKINYGLDLDETIRDFGSIAQNSMDAYNNLSIVAVKGDMFTSIEEPNSPFFETFWSGRGVVSTNNTQGKFIAPLGHCLSYSMGTSITVPKSSSYASTYFATELMLATFGHVEDSSRMHQEFTEIMKEIKEMPDSDFFYSIRGAKGAFIDLKIYDQGEYVTDMAVSIEDFFEARKNGKFITNEPGSKKMKELDFEVDKYSAIKRAAKSISPLVNYLVQKVDEKNRSASRYLSELWGSII
ncbi:MAG: hypothetical protein NDI94_03255 [Candidatus Woesearchaeota archaeon]|nr:hypothetical protein [Candidatus Woesearchaeota archaeon]